MISDRERRLRTRIDELADQRDNALDQAARWKHLAGQRGRRIYEVTHSRDLWRQRAIR